MGLTFTRRIAKNKILIPYIDRYLAKGEFPDIWKLSIKPLKDPDTFNPTFHPSGDCLPCARELYRKYHPDTPDEDTDSTSQKNFAVGNFWHIWLQTILVDGLGFATWADVEKRCHRWDGTVFDRPLWCGSGSADIVCDIPGYGRYLIDFKTMNSRVFKMDECELTYLLTKWKYQVQCYMSWMDIDKTIVIGIQKDTPHEFREFVIESKPELLVPVYEKWTEVAWALRNNTMPAECEHTLNGIPCPTSSLSL